MVKIKAIQFCVEKLKMKRKKDINAFAFQSGDSYPRFSVISCPSLEFSLKMRVTRSNLGKEVKNFSTLPTIIRSLTLLNWP